MSIIRNFERVAYGFQDEHACAVCFTSKIHQVLQNLYTLELTRTCRQNLDLIKAIKCAICKSDIPFIRRDVRQVATKQPFIEIHLEKSPTFSQVEAVNARVHMGARPILWYNDGLLRVTNDLLSLWSVDVNGRVVQRTACHSNVGRREQVPLINVSEQNSININTVPTFTPMIVNSAADRSQSVSATFVLPNEHVTAQTNYCNNPGFRVVHPVANRSEMPLAPREPSVRDYMYEAGIAGSGAQPLPGASNALLPCTTWSMTQIDYNNLNARRESSKKTVGDIRRSTEGEPENK